MATPTPANLIISMSFGASPQHISSLLSTPSRLVSASSAFLLHVPGPPTSRLLGKDDVIIAFGIASIIGLYSSSLSMLSKKKLMFSISFSCSVISLQISLAGFLVLST